jgi:peroxiredoxin
MDYGEGHLATDFIAEDTSGAQVRLSDMRGKIILLDFWATWCGPCIQAFPHIQTIRDRFKSDTNVVVISVSIDEDKEKWKRAVDKYKLPSPSWLIDRAELGQYQIHGIPRIIIIDSQFHVKSFSGLEARQQKEINELIVKLKGG